MVRLPSCRRSSALVCAGLIAACSSGDGTDSPKQSPPAETTSAQAPAGGDAAPVTIRINVDGHAGEPWTVDSFGRVDHWSVTGDSGRQRAVWSLPKLAAELVSPRARAVRVRGRDGPIEITPEQWRADEAIPALRRNRRGEVKFQWVGADGRPRLDLAELPGVTEIHLIVDAQ